MRPKIYLGGTYDLLHEGHRWQFRQYARLGDLIVSVNTDSFVARYKGVYPAQNLQQRLAAVREDEYVYDAVINSGDEDSKPSILEASPDFIGHGTDWTTKDGLLEQMGLSWAWLDAHGIAMLYLDRLPGFSSTAERAKLLRA